MLDYKKLQKELYQPSAIKPALIDVKEMQFLMIDGKGDPNGEAFEIATGALYSVAYGLKMLPKKGITPDGYVPYVVPPLEGIWDIADGVGYDPRNKDNLVWTIMIRQPDFVTAQWVDTVIAQNSKKGNPMLPNVRLQTQMEGLCVQMLHLGTYDTEPETFEKLAVFAHQQGYTRNSKKHREIYLSDPRKTVPEKLKTILRFRVDEL
ncbi:MAG: GyrI-like domain-containing protein [Hyphomonadaceae bacterium]|nr:GyrI-like domain-containing protein [Clostridia bacterium]